MRSLLGRFHRPMSRGAMGDMLTMNSLGDGSTLSLDFTTGVLDSRLTFSRAGGGTYVGADGYIYGVDSATSASLAIGTGSKSVTLTATAGVDRRFEVGQTVYFSSGANNMSGLVTAYNASTQVITINATATTGSGSFTSWFVGNASPRFDYSPTNIGEPRGLLIEGQTVNIMRGSQTIAGSEWSSSAPQFTVTLNTTDLVAPNNTNTATKLVYASGYARAVQTSITVVASTTYTFSYWIKSTGVSYWRVYDATGGAFILENVAIPASAEWQRVTKTFTTPAGCTSIWAYVADGANAGTYYVWGAQIELGTGASSYIPTGASGVTRTTDSCLISGTNFSSWFNNTEGTCLFVGDNSFIPAASNFATNWALISAANSLRINNYTRHTSGRLGASARDSGGTALTFDSPTGSPTNITTTAVYKTAFALKTNDFAYCVNGNTVGLGDGNGVFETVTSIEFARDAIRNGHIKQFKFFPTRLPNAQLQTLTAP